MESALTLTNVCFSYPKSDTNVINNFSLEVEKGSFTTLLGSSGSGKTTLLRLISGFLEPTSGEIKVNGQIINGVAPEKRKIGMVFQDYALFPHMTVLQNLMYGLKLKNADSPKASRKSKEELLEIINKTASVLDLAAFMNRFPGELSGGQQQRVALGRALVLEPGILLMDEPLSSLDTKLRQSVRAELREIQQRLKITTIYVTHDQEEALCLSDKIAVLNEGKLLQYGTSRQIYFEPADRFTAEFIGAANFINIEEKEHMVRPEWIKIFPQDYIPNSANKDSVFIKGTVNTCEFLGSKTRFKVSTEKGLLLVDSDSIYAKDFVPGTNVTLQVL